MMARDNGGSLSHIPAPAVTVRDVTGAGDSFLPRCVGRCITRPMIWACRASRRRSVRPHGAIRAKRIARFTCGFTLNPLINIKTSPHGTILVYSDEGPAHAPQANPSSRSESTIISHGMPYPQNVQTAREAEQIIRDGGATPATIALIDGKICVGLSDAQLEQLGNTEGVLKVSRRDLPYVLSQKTR